MRRIGSLLLVVASFASTLLVAELVIRWAGISVGSVHINRKTIQLDPDPRLRYTLRPSSVAHAEVDYRINSLGLRGPQTTFRKPPGIRRIVVSGDSIAFGYWVDVEDAFPRQLEMLANRHSREAQRFEVINLGVPGYNLRQELELLQTRGLRFDPDLVVISVCLNDLEGVFTYEYGLATQREKERESDDWWTRARSFALDHSMLAAWLEYRLTYLDYRQTFATTRVAAEDAAAKPGRDDPTARAVRAEKIEKQRQSLREVLSAFAQVLRRNGDVPGLVVHFPGLDYDFDAYPHHTFHELVADVTREVGLPYLDLFDCYRAYPAPALAVDPVHPSPVGHRVAAHAILEAFDDLGVLPGGLDRDGLGGCGDYRVEDFATVRGY